jgi:hypothetical protein
MARRGRIERLEVDRRKRWALGGGHGDGGSGSGDGGGGGGGGTDDDSWDTGEAGADSKEGGSGGAAPAAAASHRHRRAPSPIPILDEFRADMAAPRPQEVTRYPPVPAVGYYSATPGQAAAALDTPQDSTDDWLRKCHLPSEQ